MADTGMYSATTKSPYPDHTTRQMLKLLFIACLIIVGVLFLFLQHVLGSLRRRSSHKVLQGIVLLAYSLSYGLVNYTLGLMQSSEYHCSEFPVWAVCLLMLLGGTDSLTTYALRDIDKWQDSCMKHLMQGALVVYIVARFGPESKYQAPLWAILFVHAIQSYMRITSMRMANKSQLLGKTVKPIDDHMKVEHMLAEASGQTPCAVNMQGYLYIVAGEHSLKNSKVDYTKITNEDEYNKFINEEYKKITTVDQIWKLKEGLLSSKLKELCLSMALSKMLNRRFAGFSLPMKDESDKTRMMVFDGLLHGLKPYEQIKRAKQIEQTKQAEQVERAFRVIEVELGFIYDLYYTRYPYVYHKDRYSTLGLPVAMVILCSWLTYKVFKNLEPNLPNLSVTTTLCLMAVVTFLEVFQLYLHMASGWFKVALIRSYVAKSLVRCCFIEILLSFKSFHPWQAKLGQYSLLQHFEYSTCRGSNCLHSATLSLLYKNKKGCKKGTPVKLSDQVKQAIVDSLVRSKGRRLTNGIRSLQNNKVDQWFEWACHASDKMVTRTILVWHIATTICKHQLAKGKNLSKEHKSMVEPASSLSQYCAYLVAFAPNLLPDHSSHSSSILHETIKEAHELIKRAKSKEKKWEKLENISEAEGDDARLVVLGARLAKQLTGYIKEDEKRWRVLTDFWADMMLYVTPSDNAKAREHLEAMAKGGEFITHLWALLTHAGMENRDASVLEPNSAGTDAV